MLALSGGISCKGSPNNQQQSNRRTIVQSWALFDGLYGCSGNTGCAQADMPSLRMVSALLSAVECTVYSAINNRKSC